MKFEIILGNPCLKFYLLLGLVTHQHEKFFGFIFQTIGQTSTYEDWEMGNEEGVRKLCKQMSAVSHLSLRLTLVNF